MAHTYYGVFLPDGKGEPVALFKDGDLAQAHRMRLPNGADGMVVETDGWGCREDIAAMFPTPEEPPPAMAVADELRKAQIKQQLTEEERDKRLTEEVKREMEEEKRAAEKAKAEQEHDHAPAQETELREPASSTATAPVATSATTPKGRRE